MKLLLFQLLTNCTIGSIVSVTFDTKLFKIVDIHYRPFWKRPLYFQITLINEYGGFEFCGIKYISSEKFANRQHSEIENTYKIFNL